MILLPSEQTIVEEDRKPANVGGFRMFLAPNRNQSIFEKQRLPTVADPLSDAGWKCQHLDAKSESSGCGDCIVVSYTNIDYVGRLENGDDESISYEYSWKPEIITESDRIGFCERYCCRYYDVTHIKKGLHNAALMGPNFLEFEPLLDRFTKLSGLINKVLR